MPHGILSQAQQEAVRPHIVGKVIHDLGCGDLELSRWLIQAGAKKVVAIDRYPPSCSRFTQVTVVVTWFHLYQEPVETVFLSWPINWQDPGLLRMVNEAKLVIYLGSNLDGNACGFREMFEHLLCREVLAHVPDRKNTLVVYGNQVVEREPIPEEFAALNQERVYSFQEVYRPNDVSSP